MNGNNEENMKRRKIYTSNCGELISGIQTVRAKLCVSEIMTKTLKCPMCGLAKKIKNS